jgi:Domain of unknown function (DUF222)/HNH endonuclease
VMGNDIQRSTTGLRELPEDLEAMAPGPRLGVVLAAVDRSRLSGRDVVRLMVARDRLVSHVQAQRAADIAEVTRRCGDDDVSGEFAALEVGAALRLTRAAAEHEVAFACSLTAALPQVGEMLGSGQVDVRRARVLVDGTAHLARDQARRVIGEVADRAAVMTTGQLRALLRRLGMTVDPGDTVKRLERAVEERRVVLEANPSGSANLLLLDLSPDVAAAARERIEHLARNLPSDRRSVDQRRADVAVDLLCGHGKPLGRGMVDLTVDLGTLLGLSEQPGELAGWGPVVADIARQVTHRQTDGRWQATVIDDNGDPLAVAVRRRPTTSQARQVRARNRTCVFPGCRRPARDSELDHTTRHTDGGPTLERNLTPLCTHHHRAKDEGDWRYRRRPNGDHTWTSPAGHTYITNGRSP